VTHTPPGAPPSLPALHLTQPLTYLSGGSQTDVYRTADRRFVLKLKALGGRAGLARRRAAQMRRLADALYNQLGHEHGLRSWLLVLADAAGKPLVVAVQPFLAGARPLDAVPLDALGPAGRAALLASLDRLVRQTLACYGATGRVADLYGYGRADGAAARRWAPRRLLAEGWRLLSQRPLLTSHNLLLTPDQRVVLVDYDLICHAPLGCGLIYGARAILLLRDLAQLRLLRRALARRPNTV
jgi:hypothetical protein